jgi:hypothetical protein
MVSVFDQKAASVTASSRAVRRSSTRFRDMNDGWLPALARDPNLGRSPGLLACPEDDSADVQCTPETDRQKFQYPDGPLAWHCLGRARRRCLPAPCALASTFAGRRSPVGHVSLITNLTALETSCHANPRSRLGPSAPSQQHGAFRRGTISRVSTQTVLLWPSSARRSPVSGPSLGTFPARCRRIARSHSPGTNPVLATAGVRAPTRFCDMRESGSMGVRR